MEWFTARQLAGMPGMPGTERGIRKKADAESWPGRKRSGTKAIQYPLSCLPPETQEAILKSLAPAAPGPVSSAVPSIISSSVSSDVSSAVSTAQAPAVADAHARDIDSLKLWQRDIMHYRCCILNVIEKRALAAQVARHQAVQEFLSMLASDDCPEHIRHYVERANARKGGDRRLSAGTIYRWFELRAKGGDIALAPDDMDKFRFPVWAGEFLRHYQTPTRPSIAAALELMPPDIRPRYHEAYRFVKKCSILDINRLRMSRKELGGLKGFVHRDTSGLLPLDVVVIDGHTMKAYVAHPVHGRPFHPEICCAIDAATRCVLGWSIGLAESAMTVADCIRHCITVSETKPFGGIPAILYSDNGAGLLAEANSSEMTGLYDRLGITHKTGIPGNSQARGLIESLNKNLWVRGARMLETFTGGKMNDDHRRKTYLRLQKEAKRGSAAIPGLMPWERFMAFLGHLVEAYHQRPHSSLPKTRDDAGRLVHLTPAQMWRRFEADGWAPELPDVHEIEAIKRPWRRVRTNRGEVRLFGNIYYAGELAHITGSDVIVEYDLHDPMKVWVRDIEGGGMICEAVWNANKVAYFPKSAQDDARERRLGRRLKLKLDQVDEIQAEAAGVGVIDISTPPSPPVPPSTRGDQGGSPSTRGDQGGRRGDRLVAPTSRLLEMPRPQQQQGFVVPEKPRAKWCFWKALDAKVRAGEAVSDKERAFWKGFQTTADYRSFIAMDEEFGEDWAAM